MTLLTSQQDPSLRKTRLYSQIAEAKKRNNHQRLFCLEAKLVHRYGLNSLNDFEDLDFESVQHETSQEVFCEEQSNLSALAIPADNPTCSEAIADTPNEQLCETSSALKEQFISTESTLNDHSSECPIKSPSVDSQDSSDVPAQSHEEISPPPPPSISHLRRWLSTFDDQIPKAS